MTIERWDTTATQFYILQAQLQAVTQERDDARKVISDLQPRSFPMQCECCGRTMTSTDDYDYHGIGNCVNICDACGGSGWEKL
jgi:hypothetical protein